MQQLLYTVEYPTQHRPAEAAGSEHHLLDHCHRRRRRRGGNHDNLRMSDRDCCLCEKLHSSKE